MKLIVAPILIISLAAFVSSKPSFRLYPVMNTLNGTLPNLKIVMCPARMIFEAINDISQLSASGKAPVYCPICMSYGNLKRALKTLNDSTFFAIHGVVHHFSKKVISSYDEAEGALSKSPFVEPADSHGQYVKSNRFETTDFSKTALSYEGHRKKVYAWYRTLVGDGSIADDIGVDTDILTNILLSAPDALKAVRKTGNYIKRLLVDISVLRMPDSEENDFMIYHLILAAYASESHDSRSREYYEKAELYGRLTWQRFVPNLSIFEHIPFAIKSVGAGRKFYENRN